MDGTIGLRSRGFLPHMDLPCATQFITWRLQDSLPDGVWAGVLRDTEHLLESERRRERVRRAEAILDAGLGSACLRGPLAAMVVDSLLFGHHRRYELEAFAVMPNHVHVVLTLLPDQRLSTITRTIKSFTAREANQMLGTSGRFWQVESFDRVVRDQEHLMRCVKYVEWNPVKAGLVGDPSKYAFSSANPRHRDRLLRAEP